MITAATPTFTHWGFKFESETEEGVTVYEGATVSGNGTSISIVIPSILGHFNLVGLISGLIAALIFWIISIKIVK